MALTWPTPGYSRHLRHKPADGNFCMYFTSLSSKNISLLGSQCALSFSISPQKHLVIILATYLETQIEGLSRIMQNSFSILSLGLGRTLNIIKVIKHVVREEKQLLQKATHIHSSYIVKISKPISLNLLVHWYTHTWFWLLNILIWFYSFFSGLWCFFSDGFHFSKSLLFQWIRQLILFC